jgi:hypothetical protein
MSERRNSCPVCKAFDPEVLEILNPETYDMNAKANLYCPDCKHTWEGKITSPRVERDYERGFII